MTDGEALVVTCASVCAPSTDVVARDIEGQLVLVPLVMGIGDTDDELYALNATGRAVWDLLDGRRTLDGVVDALAERFEAPRDELTRDVLGLVGEMTRLGLLTVKS
jgi:hypothetical protein